MRIIVYICIYIHRCVCIHITYLLSTTLRTLRSLLESYISQVWLRMHLQWLGGQAETNSTSKTSVFAQMFWWFLVFWWEVIVFSKFRVWSCRSTGKPFRRTEHAIPWSIKFSILEQELWLMVAFLPAKPWRTSEKVALQHHRLETRRAWHLWI